MAILGVPVADLPGLFGILNTSVFPGNLFLKHLIVLADFGGEQLQRLNRYFDKLFPHHEMEYRVNNKLDSYKFRCLPISGKLNGQRLGISGKQLLKKHSFNDLYQDLASVLMFGGISNSAKAAGFLKNCEIGRYLGNPEELKQFVKQRYIWVSRITMGSRSNSLGQLAQQFVLRHLQENLSTKGTRFYANGTIPGITHTGETSKRQTSFDLVIARGDKYVAVEVSFQVTTNSVIERKAGQCQARFNQIECAGYKIAYVLDGAGNFERESALRTICQYSHCNVAFSVAELDVLCEFIGEYLA